MIHEEPGLHPLLVHFQAQALEKKALKPEDVMVPYLGGRCTELFINVLKEWARISSPQG